MAVDIRKGMPERRISREAFEDRFQSQFIDPAFAPLKDALQSLTLPHGRKLRVQQGGADGEEEAQILERRE